MIFAIAALAGICAVAAIALLAWWAADRAASAEWDAVEMAWLATGRDVVTAIRADTYRRSDALTGRHRHHQPAA